MGHPSWSLRAQNVAELQIAADCPGPAELAKLFLQQLDTVYLFGLSDKIVFARPPARSNIVIARRFHVGGGGGVICHCNVSVALARLFIRQMRQS